jgi:putative YphP/YqiW family bacilliredoxin
MQDSTTFRPLYDPTAVQPMRDELVRVGFRELRSAADVDAYFTGAPKGTALIVVNSVCGCAAGGARPGVMIALQHRVIPDHLFTVFAGQDRDATDTARSYFHGYAPSSPSIALFQDGKIIGMVERHQIERRSPGEIAESLTALFDSYCTRSGPSISAEEFARIAPHHACGSSIPRFSG